MVIMAPPTNSRFRKNLEKEIEYEIKQGGSKLDTNLDMKKLRRRVSNRLSARKGREKKTQHILDLKTSMENLQELISSLSERVQQCKEQQQLLMLENVYLRKKVDERSFRSKLQGFETERLKHEIRKLEEFEKVVNKHKLDSSSARLYKLDLIVTEFPKSHYPNLSFYEDRIQNLNKFKFDHHQLPSSEVGSSGMSEIGIRQFHETSELGKVQEIDIDQYLNFDAAVHEK